MRRSQHIKVAKNLREVRLDLMDLFCTGPKKLKGITKVEGARINKILSKVDKAIGVLDDVYCEGMSKEDFNRNGSVYYGSKALSSKIKKT